MTSINQYNQLCQEIDELCLEGFFGPQAKDLTLIRDDMDINEYLEFSLNDWIEDNEQYGKSNIIYFTYLFLLNFIDAYRDCQKEMFEILNAFFKGYPNFPELEVFSSFQQFCISFQDAKLGMIEIQKSQNPTIGEKLIYSQKITKTYEKGIELIGKILTICIIVLKLKNNQEYDPPQIEALSLYQKTKIVSELSNGKYDEIINSIDRRIRNAEAHLNIRFVPRKNVFQYKMKKGKKYQYKEISAEEFILHKFPVIAWIPRAYFNANLLLLIAYNDKNKFMNIYKRYFKINKST